MFFFPSFRFTLRPLLLAPGLSMLLRGSLRLRLPLLLLSLRLLGLGLSLHRSLLLLPLNLRPLLILLLPLLPHCLLLSLRPRLITLDAIGFLPLPISIGMPAFPVLLKLSVWNPLIVPRVSAPIMVSVISSPTWVYIEIEPWDMIKVGPTPVIIVRAIPAAFPQIPPPAVIEKQVCAYIGNGVDIGRIGQHYHIGRRLKDDGRRQSNSYAYAYLRHC